MSQDNNRNTAHQLEICKKINYDLLVRTVVRLAPDVASEIKKSGQEFLEFNEQDSAAANEFFAETVGLVTDALVSQIKNEMPKNQKETNDE